jgi:hypothetical protein
MAENSSESPIQLPVPVEQVSNSSETANSANKSTETVPTGGELSNLAPPAALPTSIPLPSPPAAPQSAGTISNSATQSNPAQASDDTDLIEKEWVNKAKQIVEQTKDNPYQQSEELTVFKADYMKKRYNRAIKLK